MALDPTEYSVRELRTELQNITDPDVIEEAIEAERDGDGRDSAIDALEGRLNAVASEGAESDSEGIEESDDAEGADDDEADETAQEDDEADESDDAEGDDEVGGEAAEEEEEAEPEPERSYPDPDSDQQVLYDPIGAGDVGRSGPPVAGHDTIHLLTDNQEPACGASVGAKGQIATRSSLAEDIDECQHCLR